MSFCSKIVDQLNVAGVPKEDVDANTYKLFDRFKELGTKKKDRNCQIGCFIKHRK